MREICINGKKYKYNSCYSFLRKTPGSSGNIDCVLQLQIFTEGKQLDWKEIKGTYEAEVIARMILDLINDE